MDNVGHRAAESDCIYYIIAYRRFLQVVDGVVEYILKRVDEC